MYRWENPPPPKNDVTNRDISTKELGDIINQHSPCLSGLSIALINHYDKSDQERKEFIWFTCPSYNPSRSKVMEETQVEKEMEAEIMKNAIYWFSLHNFLCLCLLFLNNIGPIIQGCHQSRSVCTFLYQSLIKKMAHIYEHTTICQGHFSVKIYTFMVFLVWFMLTKTMPLIVNYVFQMHRMASVKNSVCF